MLATVDTLLAVESVDSPGHFPSSLPSDAGAGRGGSGASSRGHLKAYKVQWCHGAPGMVHLLCRAAEVTGQARYLEAAVHAGHAVWESGLLRKGVGLCHGISGNAFVLLRLARATGDDRWHTRAVEFARFAVDHLPDLADVPDHPHFLYEGTLGLAALLLDLCSETLPAHGGQTCRPSFPAYEFESFYL